MHTAGFVGDATYIYFLISELKSSISTTINQIVFSYKIHDFSGQGFAQV